MAECCTQGASVPEREEEKSDATAVVVPGRPRTTSVGKEADEHHQGYPSRLRIAAVSCIRQRESSPLSGLGECVRHPTLFRPCPHGLDRFLIGSEFGETMVDGGISEVEVPVNDVSGCVWVGGPNMGLTNDIAPREWCHFS